MDSITSFIIALGAFVTALATAYAQIIRSRKELKSTISRNIAKQTDIDVLILKKMDRLKEILDADRVQIYDFHNGGRYANGRSALKTTCTYEVLRAGEKSHQSELQSVPLSFIPGFIKQILDEGFFEVTDIESMKDITPAAYQIKKAQGLKSFYDISLNNEQGDPIGFLAVQYTRCHHKPFSKPCLEEIKRLKFFIEENLEKIKHK